MRKLKLTERGWPGHYILCERCVFHRNTLIEFGAKRVVVSTVGNLRKIDPPHAIDTIGCGRYYETKAFPARWDAPYWEAATSGQLDFKSPWSICAENPEDLPDDADTRADRMHERVVAEISRRLKRGKV
ncbi:MAG: hypothetical protein ABFE07_28175 [Armatimonadia bacterium]